MKNSYFTSELHNKSIYQEITKCAYLYTSILNFFSQKRKNINIIFRSILNVIQGTLPKTGIKKISLQYSGCHLTLFRESESPFVISLQNLIKIQRRLQEKKYMIFFFLFKLIFKL